MAYKGVGGGKKNTGSTGRGKGRSGPRQPESIKRGGPGASRARAADGQRKPPFDKGRRPAARVEAHATPKAPAVHAPDDKVMGVNPVLELLRSGGRPLDALYIDKEKGGKHFEEMIALARAAGAKLKVVPREALDKMAGLLRHQGVIAVTAPKAYADPDELVEKALTKEGLPLIVILDGVEDPQNLGSILRTAESAGADGVVIPEHRAAHLSAAVARSSAGALEYMPVAKVTNVVDFIGKLKEKGFWVIGLEGGAKQEYTGFDMKAPLAVVLGSEGGGIRPLVKKKCDALVSLPMLGKVSSLNVSVAAGVVLYEAVRQRRGLNPATSGAIRSKSAESPEIYHKIT